MSSTSSSKLSGDRELVCAIDSATRRAFGVYFTPEPLARLMASLLRSQVEKGRHLIDPSAGSGRLLTAAVRQFALPLDRALMADRIHGVERNNQMADWTDRALSQLLGVARSYCYIGDGLSLLETSERQHWFGRTHFGAVIANPPYVREKHNRQLFSELLERVPSWKHWFRPRQDLQQLFLTLGVLLLEDGGELVYLVNPYWLHSDSGQPLRELMREQTTVLSIVDFGERRLFRDAPGQHNLLIHARRDEAPSASYPTRFVRVSSKSGGSLEDLCQKVGRALEDGTGSAELKIHQSNRPLGSGPRKRWYWPGPADDQLAALETRGIPLGEAFHTHQGVVSGADSVTRRNREVLGEEFPLKTGIYVLSGEEVAALKLNARERQLCKPLYRARDIDRFEVKGGNSRIIYLTWHDDLARLPAIRAHLERFKPFLSRRREVQLGKMPWFALHWPRDPSLFERPRIVTPRRATEPRFAMGKPGYCEQSDIALITDPNDDDVRLKALLVVLNSELIASWSKYRGKHKGSVREFFGRALEELPIPRAARDDPSAFVELARYAHKDLRADGSRAVEELFLR